jgi:hypothetical protein
MPMPALVFWMPMPNYAKKDGEKIKKMGKRKHF